MPVAPQTAAGPRRRRPPALVTDAGGQLNLLSASSPDVGGLISARIAAGSFGSFGMKIADADCGQRRRHRKGRSRSRASRASPPDARGARAVQPQRVLGQLGAARGRRPGPQRDGAVVAAAARVCSKTVDDQPEAGSSCGATALDSARPSPGGAHSPPAGSLSAGSRRLAEVSGDDPLREPPLRLSLSFVPPLWKGVELLARVSLPSRAHR